MSEIVTEDFKQSLYSAPEGEKKANPTIFDEIRWALQHAQKPLEQVLQLISEFHGLWTGMSTTLMQFVSSIGALQGSKDINAYIKVGQQALNLANQTVLLSKIGRMNNITCNTMPIELLREFVSRCQAIHPAVYAYIQQNIGKYPYFQKISESVCGFGQHILNKHQVDPMKRPEQNGKQTMTTNYRVRRNTDFKLFDVIQPLVDNSANLLDVMFLRAMQVDNNMSLLHDKYSAESPIAHGHHFTMSVFDADRDKKAIQPCILEASKRFGPTLQLCDWAFPVDHQIQKQPQWFTLSTEIGSYQADELNRPILREPELAIAKDEDRSEIV